MRATHKKLPLFLLFVFLVRPAATAQDRTPPSVEVPPPFTSLEEIEEFLRTARIVSGKELGKGVTVPMKLSLDDGRVRHDAIFKSIDERRFGLTQLGNTSEVDFKDSWKFEIAAYEMDKLLGIHMVPVTVERVYNGRRGSLQFWVNDAMSEEDRQKKNLKPPNPDEWRQQMFKVRVFDNLVYNIDRNLGNLLITPDWKLHMIDHSRTFKNVGALKSPKDLTYFSRSLMEALQKIDETRVTAHCGKYLSQAEIRLMLKRRDMILKHYEKLVSERGPVVTYP